MAENRDFTLNEFRKQFDQLEALGGAARYMMRNMMDLPGYGEVEDSREELQRIRRIIDAMTEEERGDPDGIVLSRRQQIAADSGTEPEQVEQFLGEFRQLREIMRQMAGMSVWERIKKVTGLRFRYPPEDEDEE